MLVSQNIKNLVSGVSQQAPVLRLPEQLDEQINGLSSEANGLVKRPPTVFIKSLLPALSQNDAPLLHFVDRDESLKYFIYFTNNQVYVIDTEGKQHTVTYQDDAADYIRTSNPQETLRVLTVADHTFVVNKKVKVTMGDEKSPDVFQTQGALVNVKQGQYGRTYQIWVNDNVLVATYTTPDGSDKSHTTAIDTSNIVSNLASQIQDKGYTVDTGSSWLRIQGVTKVQTKDGFNNQAMVGFTSSAQKFTLLPATAPDGYTIKIHGDPKGDSAGSYYVSYDSEEVVWKECAKPDILIHIDPKTMPHELVRQADDTFVFKTVDWKDRVVGDDNSNPFPSFIDNTINDMAFHRNRLVFLSNENVICSESAEYFNFWMTTANDVEDTDTIDVSTTTERVNLLHYAVNYNGELYCFSDKSQFALRADGVLSPKNTALVEITEFNSTPSCRPVRAGRNLYFPANRAEYTTIKEYYSVQQVSEEKNAQDITSHVPDYIPNGVYQIASNTNENIMLFLTRGDTSSVYVYKYLYLNEQRVQSSWSKWEMGDSVFGAFFTGSTLYLLINRGGKHCLEKMEFTSQHTKDFTDHEPYRVILDAKKIASTASYDETTECTSFDLLTEYQVDAIADDTVFGCVTSDGIYRELKVTHGHITMQGDHRDKDVVIGLPFRFHARLSPIYLTQKGENGSSTSILTGRLQLRYIHLNYADTGGFTVHVSYKGGKNCTYVMSSREIGSRTTTLGQQAEDTGIFKFPVQSLNTNIEIDIDSALPLPVSLIGFLWEGNFIPRSKGV